MNLAANKFKILKSKEIWEAPALEDGKLIKLKVHATDLKKKLANKQKQVNSDQQNRKVKKEKLTHQEKEES